MSWFLRVRCVIIHTNIKIKLIIKRGNFHSVYFERSTRSGPKAIYTKDSIYSNGREVTSFSNKGSRVGKLLNQYTFAFFFVYIYATNYYLVKDLQNL